mmetsp:Transcript_22430/g.48980  ORF Transcript_22430/g.48980 Transcript_22430/m.48980 type:complete len:85 (-) Transcript_22430:571-825(-)
MPAPTCPADANLTPALAPSEAKNQAVSNAHTGSTCERAPEATPNGQAQYLTAEEKAKLYAKYGTIQRPTASEMQQMTAAGCKMQ